MLCIKILILDQEKCKQSYGFIEEGHICAGNYNFGGKDSCQGDSGGALWWKHPTNQQIYQVYKLSLEKSCCKRRQKSPGNKERLKVLNDTKLVLNENEWPP